MARITVEDCLENVSNRFTLVLVSAERTKDLLKGRSALVANEDENKEVVTALREIAAGKVRVDDSSVQEFDMYKPREGQAEDIADFDDELPPEA